MCVVLSQMYYKNVYVTKMDERATKSVTKCHVFVLAAMYKFFVIRFLTY